MIRVLGLMVAGAGLSGGALAAIAHDQNVTNAAIFGSGNTNGSYTVDRASGVEIGLRGKLRHNATGAPENTFNSQGDGTFTFDAGVAPTQASPTAVWNFEWSINSDFDGSAGGRTLDGLTYLLGLDTDASQGTSFLSFDPLLGSNHPNGWWDHSMGNNATAQGAGAEATDVASYEALLAASNLAQQSWKAHWFFGPGFDPTVDATYDIFLAAYNDLGEQLARSDIQIIVGAGGSAVTSVPEPTSLALALAGLALAGLAASRRKKA